MKRKALAFVAAVSTILIMGSVKKAKCEAADGSLRVLDYTYNCIGSGGNCLPTVVIKPEAN